MTRDVAASAEAELTPVEIAALSDPRIILDAIPVRVAWLDHDLRFLYANAASLRLLGVSRAEARGRQLSELTSERGIFDVDAVRAAVAGEPAVISALAEPVGAPSEWRQLHLIPLAQPDGRGGVLIVGFDITARVAAEQASLRLDEESARLRQRQAVAVAVGESVVTSLVDTMKGLSADDVASARSQDVKAAIRSVDDAMGQLRRIIRELRGAMRYDAAASAPDAESSADIRTSGLTDTSLLPDVTAADPAGLTPEQLLRLLDHVPAAVTAFRLGFYATFANRVALDRYGCAELGDFVGKQGRQLLGDTAYEASLPFGLRAMAGQPQQFDRVTFGSDGALHHAQIEYNPIVMNGRTVGAVSVLYDVTERVQAEAVMRSSAAYVTAARERQRIAEDFHDLVIQRLYAAGLTLASAVDDLAVKRASATIAEALDELESAIHGLSDDEPALPEAVDRVMRNASHVLGFVPWVAMTGEIGCVSTELQADIVAVLTEALSNVARHASATEVTVDLDVHDDGVRLRVCDNGRGIGAPARTSGLTNLAARARRHHGTFHISALPNRGTELVWTVPIT